MAAYSKDREMFFISNIRQLLAIDPQMSAVEMQNQLADNGLNLDREYIGRLAKKYLTARIHRLDLQTQKKAIAQIHDILTETTRRMWPILLAKTSTSKEKIAAAGEIREAHHLAYKLMQEAGYFEPPKLGTIEVNVHHDQTVDALMADIRKLWDAPLPTVALVVPEITETDHGAIPTP